MERILNKVCESLEGIDRSSSWDIMSEGDRKVIAEIVAIKKDLLKIEKLEDELEGGSSQAGGMGYSGYDYSGDSYAMDGRSGRGYSGMGYSGRRGRSRRTGRFVSRDAGPDGMREHLENMLRDAETPDQRAAIQRRMRQLDME